jgi:hypothetical protein
LTNLDEAGDVIYVDQGEQLSYVDLVWELVFEMLKSVRMLAIPPWGKNLCPTSVALAEQYLNFRQHQLGTIIIQTVHILPIA